MFIYFYRYWVGLTQNHIIAYGNQIGITWNYAHPAAASQQLSTSGKAPGPSRTGSKQPVQESLTSTVVCAFMKWVSVLLRRMKQRPLYFSLAASTRAWLTVVCSKTRVGGAVSPLPQRAEQKVWGNLALSTLGKVTSSSICSNRPVLNMPCIYIYAYIPMPKCSKWSVC